MKYTNQELEIDGLSYSIEIDVIENEYEWDNASLLINKVVDLDLNEGNSITVTDWHYEQVQNHLDAVGPFELLS